MSKYAIHLVNIIGYGLVAVFIAMQQDVDGSLLIEGWKGLKLAMLGALGMVVWSVYRAMLTIVLGEELA